MLYLIILLNGPEPKPELNYFWRWDLRIIRSCDSNTYRVNSLLVLCQTPSSCTYQTVCSHSGIYRLQAFTLPRSHSSPSPPSSKQASGRSDNNRKYSHKFRKRQGSGIIDAQRKSVILDWSTSYHAGSSRLVWSGRSTIERFMTLP